MMAVFVFLILCGRNERNFNVSNNNDGNYNVNDHYSNGKSIPNDTSLFNSCQGVTCLLPLVVRQAAPL